MTSWMKRRVRRARARSSRKGLSERTELPPREQTRAATDDTRRTQTNEHSAPAPLGRQRMTG
jgi:hypothetical protein